MSRPSQVLAAALVAAAALAAPLAAQQAQRVALSGNDFEIYNLIGTIRVESTAGAAAAEVTLQGADAGRLSVHNEAGRLSIVFPGSAFVYPALSGSGETQMRVEADGTFGDDDDDRGRKVWIRGKGGDGLTAWADVRLLLPRGARAEVNMGVGKVTLANVNGRISVETASGDVEGTGTSGDLSVDTGSGDVTLTGHTGDLSVDTGSGNIVLARVSGGTVNLDTGSGDVRVDGVSSPSLGIDTGSGEVVVGAAAVDTLSVDTGSGDVSIALTRAFTSLDVDTGSGDVSVTAPKGIGAQVDLETSGGDITTEFPIQLTRKSSDGLQGTIGDGKGTLTVETGSGDITLRQQT